MFERRTYISDKEAQYFTDHKLMCADAPPVEGSYLVGDVVISATQKDDVFGWVCVASGNPGTWEIINDLKLIKEAISALEKQDISINSNINILKEGILKLTSEAMALDKEHKEELNRINERVSTNANNITTVNNEIEKIKEAAGSLQGNMTESLNLINKAIANNTNNITNNSNKITEIEKDIDSINDKTNKHDEDINNISNQITENIERVDNIDKQVNANLESLKGLNENINNKYEELSGSVTAGTEKITKLEIATNEIKGDVGDIKESLGMNNEGEEPVGIKKEIEDIKGDVDEIKESLGMNNEGEEPVGIKKEIEDLKSDMDALLKYWVGTQDQYDALTEKEPGRLYIIID